MTQDIKTADEHAPRPYVKPSVERIPLSEARGADVTNNYSIADSETFSS